VLLTNPLLRDIIFPDQAKSLEKTLRMEPQGVEMIAGRTALVVAFYELSGGNVPQFKLWIDRRYGLILRRQLLESTTSMVISDMVVTQVYIDNPIPAALFNPLEAWEGGFAEGPSGKTAPLDALPPTPTWALPTTRQP
jgi:negative regulator of sigma E activity